MSFVVFLDSGPLGFVSNPRRSAKSVACWRWAQDLLNAGTRVIIPEIADFEIRRELLRANRIKGIDKLDGLARIFEYLPITTAAMRQAALFWAQSRQLGQPTAAANKLDADVILAGQAVMLGAPNYVIATTNVGHISRYAPADRWENI